jgi:hypothetical protein
MPFGDFIDGLGPSARVATAVLPFAFAAVIRFIYGSTFFTRLLISVSVLWFSVNILAAPYSPILQPEIAKIRMLLR